MPPRKILLRSLAVATAMGAFTSLRLLGALWSGQSYPGGVRDLIISLIYLYAWASQVPLLARFFVRYPLRCRPWNRIPSYFGIGLLAALGPAALNRGASYLANRLFTAPTPMRGNFAAEWFASFLAFWLVAGIFQTVEARSRLRELQTRLTQAELQNLKSQLHPHFLFNTLHTISVLMREDVDAANRVLLKLSDLLRVSLDRTRTDRIPLQQELDFLEAYLSIEQTRFQERLHISISVDGDCRAALIPSLFLQPLVENALRHGLAPRAAGGTLSISAQRIRDTLQIRVEDDGVGLAADYSTRRAAGCGLRNTEGRLRALCGPAGTLEVTPRPGGGVAVRVALPYCPS